MESGSGVVVRRTAWASFVTLVAIFTAAAAPAGELHPIEGELRLRFPTVALESAATFEPGDTFVRGRVAAGLRAQFAGAPSFAASGSPPRNATAGLQVLYPGSYDGLTVVQLGDQRVVLRATGASPAQAVVANGKLIYAGSYPSTDVVQVPRNGRSEELLLLRDRSAPRTFDYEIVDIEGVGAVALDDGAIRFFPEFRQPAISAPSAGRFTHREPTLQIDRPWLIDASGRRSNEAAWTLLGEGPIPAGIRLTVTAESLSFPAVVDPSFSATGTLSLARLVHTSTLLPNGKVLIAGGNGSTSAELYDPSTGAFSPTGDLVSGRSFHTATLLPNGKVLIAGGMTGDAGTSRYVFAELYDPATGRFTATGSLGSERYFHTATLLSNGNVLLAGGTDPGGNLASAVVYSPQTGTFTATGNGITPRKEHTATLLPNGKVLVAGGRGGDGGGQLGSAELYDPSNGTFAATGSLVTARSGSTATLLPNGKVLVAAGLGGPGDFLTSAELYDPPSGSFTATGLMGFRRTLHTATLLPNGKVLVAGGAVDQPDSVELYDAATGTFSATGSLSSGRFYHTATLLSTGRALLVGGSSDYGGFNVLGTAEMYESAGGTFGPTGSLGTARREHSVALLPNGNVLIAGGYQGTALASSELYHYASETWSPTGSLGTARHGATATLLLNGKVLIAGGFGAAGGVSPAELYDPSSGTFTATGGLGTARAYHTATLLPNGKVLIAGGANTPVSYVTAAEVYDPSTATFTATGSLGTARGFHTATLLPNGHVLFAGGYNGTSIMTTELYDPASGTFSASGSLGVPRYIHSATLLPNDDVLISGGYGDSYNYLNSAELYDSASKAFFLPGNYMASTRGYHTATLLPNGKVLIAGGTNGAADLVSAELYDPASATFSETGSLVSGRALHKALVLPNGKVLIVAGRNNASEFSSAELYDVGEGFAEARRPVIASAPSTLTLPAALTLIGSGFRGDSEASSGGTNGSATNFPIVQLQRIDNEQTFFVAPTTTFSDVSWSASFDVFRLGWYRATLFRNGIPGIQRLVAVTAPTPAIASLSPESGPFAGGQTVTITGTNLSGVTVIIGGISATVIDTTPASATFVTPPHAAGIVDVMLTTPSAVSTTETGAYRYLAATPADVVATAASATSVQVTWTAGAGATAYQVLRSTDGVTFATVATVPGTSATDPSVSADTAYLYAVRVSSPAPSGASAPDLVTTVLFTDPTLVAKVTSAKAVHLSELRTAVNAVRQLAGFAPRSYSDASLEAGISVIRAVHITELRTALNGPRLSLGLAGMTYSRPVLTAGVTSIGAADVEELRDGTQ